MSSDQLRAMVGRPKAEAAELFQIIVMLAAATNQECDEPRQLAYAIGLRGVPIESLRKALPELLQKSKFMPSISEIRIICGVDVSAEARAAVAYEKVCRASSHVGSYKSIRFDDPVINSTIIALGGWVEACDTPKDCPHWRHRFITTYKALLEAKKGTMSALLGVAARENAGSGFESQAAITYECGLPPVPGISYEPVEQRLGRALGIDAQKLLKGVPTDE